MMVRGLQLRSQKGRLRKLGLLTPDKIELWGAWGSSNSLPLSTRRLLSWWSPNNARIQKQRQITQNERRGADWVQGIIFSPWGQLSNGTGFPELLWSAHIWRTPRPSWLKPCAIWSNLTVVSVLSRRWDLRTPDVPSKHNYSLIL